MNPQDLAKHEWVVQQCEATQFFISGPGWANVRNLPDKLGIGYKMITSYIKGTYGYFAYRKQDLVEITNWIFDNEKASPGALAALIERWRADERAYLRACERFPDISKLDDSELVRAYETWSSAYCDQWAIALIADSWNLHSEELLLPRLRSALRKAGREEELPKIFPILTAPVDMSFAAGEEAQLWSILAAIPQGERHTAEGVLRAAKEKLDAHAKAYHWIQNSYLRATRLGAADFARMLAGMASKDPGVEIARITSSPLRARENKQRVVRELALDEEMRTLLSLTETITIWQDTRKRNNLIGDAFMQLFLDELCARKGWQAQECSGISCLEFEDALTGKMEPDVIFERSKALFSLYTHDGIQVTTGAEAARLFSAVSGAKEHTVADLRGMCASSGSAQGIARIVRETKDIPKMRKGDILISGMTRPELVPAMKIAAAVVTDEGGITSHAAIVSRELGIPCVVGTRSATSVFKDGDLVEVRADHGVVRRLDIGERDD
jgi:phosphohistidine swiveling domain-containing protein